MNMYMCTYICIHEMQCSIYKKKEKLLNCLNKPDKKQNENNAF